MKSSATYDFNILLKLRAAASLTGISFAMIFW